MSARGLNSDLLFAYAAGGASRAMGLLVETYLQLRPEARDEAALYEAMGGALLESEPEAALSEGALDAVLARLGDQDADEAPVNDDAPLADDDPIRAFPEPLQAAARAALAKRSWKFAGPGLRVLSLGEDDEPSDVSLLRIQPGHGAPRHTHRGAEVTLVVRGAFRDETGRYGPGDVSIASPELTHRPVAEPGETCYALAVTNAPLQFTGPLGWVQRAFGG